MTEPESEVMAHATDIQRLRGGLAVVQVQDVDGTGQFLALEDAHLYISALLNSRKSNIIELEARLRRVLAKMNLAERHFAQASRMDFSSYKSFGVSPEEVTRCPRHIESLQQLSVEAERMQAEWQRQKITQCSAATLKTAHEWIRHLAAIVNEAEGTAAVMTNYTEVLSNDCLSVDMRLRLLPGCEDSPEYLGKYFRHLIEGRVAPPTEAATTPLPCTGVVCALEKLASGWRWMDSAVIQHALDWLSYFYRTEDLCVTASTSQREGLELLTSTLDTYETTGLPLLRVSALALLRRCHIFGLLTGTSDQLEQAMPKVCKVGLAAQDLGILEVLVEVRGSEYFLNSAPIRKIVVTQKLARVVQWMMDPKGVIRMNKKMWGRYRSDAKALLTNAEMAARK